MDYRLTDEQQKNLMFFLNRVTFQGLAEIAAINSILNTLNNPTKKD